MKKFVLFAILFALLSLFSCRTTIKYVPVENVRTDSVYINRFHVDTTYVRDSIRVHERGDTVRIYKDRYVYRYMNKTDTMYLSRVDSISVPFPVEKELSKWQRTKVDYGGWALIIVFVFIIILFGKLIYKLKK